MTTEWLDEDGYPTDAALERIEKWPVEDNVIGLLDFVASLWHWPNCVWKEEKEHEWKKETVTHICFATGGWSGNESLIDALNANFLGNVKWVMSKRGGYHEYEYEDLT